MPLLGDYRNPVTSEILRGSYPRSRCRSGGTLRAGLSARVTWHENKDQGEHGPDYPRRRFTHDQDVSCRVVHEGWQRLLPFGFPLPSVTRPLDLLNEHSMG